MIGYHLSNPLFREKISQEGLTPQTGESYAINHGDEATPAIFFSVGSGKRYNSTYDDDLYEVDLTQVTLIQDPVLKTHMMTYEPVGLDKIKLIYKGTGSSQ